MGRKRGDGESPKCRVNLTLRLETVQWLQSQGNMSEAIDKLVKNASDWTNVQNKRESLTLLVNSEVGAFKMNQSYTRDEIYRVLGGEKQTYLPQRNGIIVCGCFDLVKNPYAPEEIWVEPGEKRQKKAKLLEMQRGSIPIFLKQDVKDVKRWQYVGRFTCKEYSEEPNLVDAKSKEVSWALAGVLRIEVSPPRKA